MKIRIMFVVTAILFGVALPAQSRDDHLKLPIKDALSTPDAKAKLSAEIRLFFGDQKYPKPASVMGTFTSNKKTNFANKSDKDGCEIAFLSAALGLQERAMREGGNAVVNIISVYKKETVSSATEYACGAGKIMGGVALRGQVVKLP